MSSEVDFGNWLDENAPALEAWGNFVVAKITELVMLEIDEKQHETFFKLLPKSRVKDKQSALDKLKIKQYSDPKEQMTDLVGARFVVLLRPEMDLVEKVLIEYPNWVRSKDRDPVGEQNSRPKHFDYQSVHYIVRSIENQVLDGVTVPANLPCEVQIRTLLQHAYAELVHDKFYKGVRNIPPAADRLVARCMALMETTDGMFVEAVRKLEAINKSQKQWCEALDDFVGPLINQYTPTAKDNDALELLEEYRDLLESASIDAVKAGLNSQVVDKIKVNQLAGNLYSKPVVLIVYWLLQNHAYEVGARWPVPNLLSGFNQVRGHLGISSR